LPVGRALAAVKHVVARKVHERNIEMPSRPREIGGTVTIDTKSAVRITLGVIDHNKPGAIHDRAGRHRSQHSLDRVAVLDVEVRTAERAERDLVLGGLLKKSARDAPASADNKNWSGRHLALPRSARVRLKSTNWVDAASEAKRRSNPALCRMSGFASLRS